LGGKELGVIGEQSLVKEGRQNTLVHGRRGGSG